MRDTCVTAALRALDTMDITLRDILEDGMGALVAAARSRILAREPGASTETLEACLPALVHARCASALAEECEWVLFPAGAGTEIRLRAAGRLFSGHYRIAPTRIRVELESERGTRVRESVLPDRSPASFTEGPSEGCLPSPEGGDCAARLFLGLCLDELCSLPGPEAS